MKLLNKEQIPFYLPLKADSHELYLTCAAAAEECGAEKLKISYLCGNATICRSRTHQMQIV